MPTKKATGTSCGGVDEINITGNGNIRIADNRFGELGNADRFALSCNVIAVAMRAWQFNLSCIG